MYRVFLLLTACVSLAVLPVQGQTAPAISAAYANDVTVDGTADPGAGPIVIVDISYEVETPVGRGEVGEHGKFAAAVSPALIQGNRLVAVDQHGRRSAPFTVAPPRPSTPAPPGN